jgi:hypothetical protein
MRQAEGVTASPRDKLRDMPYGDSFGGGGGG